VIALAGDDAEIDQARAAGSDGRGRHAMSITRTRLAAELADADRRRRWGASASAGAPHRVANAAPDVARGGRRREMSIRAAAAHRCSRYSKRTWRLQCCGHMLRRLVIQLFRAAGFRINRA
jgi:hypothetical protein